MIIIFFYSLLEYPFIESSFLFCSQSYFLVNTGTTCTCSVHVHCLLCTLTILVSSYFLLNQCELKKILSWNSSLCSLYVLYLDSSVNLGREKIFNNYKENSNIHNNLAYRKAGVSYKVHRYIVFCLT